MLIKKSKIPFKSLITVGILPSFLKKTVYKAKGYKIGKNVNIGFGSVIIGKNVTIEANVKIGLATIIRAEQIKIERFAAIGSFTVIDTGRLRIGEDARINEQVIIGGMKTPSSSLDLGKRTIIMEYSFINTTMPVTIGDDSGIGGHCLLFTHGSWLNQLEGFPVAFAPITLGNSVWLPWRVFIMPGVTIGDKVVVGANSLISNSVESNCLIAGSPAKVIKENYPSPISSEKIEVVFQSYLTDFIEFLNYNNIPTNSKTEGATQIIMGISENKSFKITVINKTMDGAFQSFENNELVIINISTYQNKLVTKIPKQSMMIDVLSKTRIGSSPVGEEFLKFVSRYGLRLNRID